LKRNKPGLVDIAAPSCPLAKFNSSSSIVKGYILKSGANDLAGGANVFQNLGFLWLFVSFGLVCRNESNGKSNAFVQPLLPTKLKQLLSANGQSTELIATKKKKKSRKEKHEAGGPRY
jgi:hypothetical protein